MLLDGVRRDGPEYVPSSHRAAYGKATHLSQISIFNPE
jgi:hypothetical protein